MGGFSGGASISTFGARRASVSLPVHGVCVYAWPGVLGSDGVGRYREGKTGLWCFFLLVPYFAD